VHVPRSFVGFIGEDTEDKRNGRFHDFSIGISARNEKNQTWHEPVSDKEESNMRGRGESERQYHE
jgi:hypothetical protein